MTATSLGYSAGTIFESRNVLGVKFIITRNQSDEDKVFYKEIGTGELTQMSRYSFNYSIESGDIELSDRNTLSKVKIVEQPIINADRPKDVQWRTKLENQAVVLTANEKVWIDYMDALPRKMDGEMHYIYKPANTYPARIYVFVHGERWIDRNKRPMGLLGSTPFLTRPMNIEEIEDHHFDNRMCYRHYESFEKLMKREEWEAEFSNIDKPGSGDEFLKKLESFKNRYIR